MEYRQFSTEEKKQLAKQFTKKEIIAYRKGKRVGFCNAVHNPGIIIKSKNKPNFTQRTYTKEFCDSLFDNSKDIKWK